MTEEITLSEAQSIIASCNTRNIVACCGRRFGKTYVALAKICTKATSRRATERGDYEIWYVAPTKDQARNIFWDKLKRFMPRQYVDGKPNESRMVMKLINGCQIKVFSAEEPDHLVGTGIDFLVMDEAALCSKEAYDYIAPALADKHHDGETLFISTPRGYNWFYKLAMNYQKMPDQWAFFEYVSREGGQITDEELEQKRKEMPAKKFKQEFEASFESLSNRVYDSYDKELNSCELDPRWGLSEIHVGMDFNVNPMTATIAVMEYDPDHKELGKCAYFFDEFVLPNSNTQYMVDMIKEKYPAAEVWVYPDPTGKKRQSSAPIGVTDLTILADAGFHVMAPYAPYKQRDKFNSVNNAFCNAAGERRAFIARGRCPELRAAFDGYSYKDNTSSDTDKSGGLDHISDAGAYFLTYRYPVKGGSSRVYRPEVLGV